MGRAERQNFMMPSVAGLAEVVDKVCTRSDEVFEPPFVPLKREAYRSTIQYDTENHEGTQST